MPMGLGLGVGVGHGRAGRALEAFAYQAETLALQTARTSGGQAMTTRELKAYDRCFTRIKKVGVTLTDGICHVPGTTLEAGSRLNIFNPGVGDMVKTGAPTYHALDGWDGFGGTAYYTLLFGLQDFTQGQFCAFYYSRTLTGASGGDWGAQTAGGDGIGGNMLDASNKCNARLQSTNYVSTSTTAFPGKGMYCFNPNSLDTWGISREAPAPTYVAPATNIALTLGKINGGATSGRRCGLFAMWKKALSASQRMEISAALTDLYEKIRFGMVDTYEAGYQPAAATYDVLVYGSGPTLIGAASAAYDEAATQGTGLTVGILCDNYCYSDSDIGGMPAQGLAYVDCVAFSVFKGWYRDATSWLNTNYYNRADANTQAGNSVESRAFTQAVRRALDPTRTGSLLPGKDIPVYFSRGIKSISAPGVSPITVVTNDGRTFTCKRFIGADYDGESVFYGGLPYTVGTEAAGSGTEALNGYNGSNSLRQPFAAYTVDPYVVSGNSGSGLLPDITTLPPPGLSIGNAEPALQAMSYRLAMTSDPSAVVPFSTVDPARNYNPLRYETVGRTYLQNTAATLSDTNVLLSQPLGGLSNHYDANNGLGNMSLDLGSSGDNYGKERVAGGSGKVTAADLRDYTFGWFKWHLADARVPSTLATQLTSRQLDATAFLDPGNNPDGLLFFPNRPYPRDPTWQLSNTGYKSTGTDYAGTDGGTPRSIKTVSVAAYPADSHSRRRVVSAGALYSQGGLTGSAQPGTDQIAPVPYEEIVPDKAVRNDMLIPWASSCTKVAWYMSRLELSGTLKGEAAGIAAVLSIVNSIAVQDVDYPTLRTKLLARDTNNPVLPQTD